MLTVVILILTVWNADTGDKLYEGEPQKIAYSGEVMDPMQYCLTQGVAQAAVLAKKYRQTYPNATANVSCKWKDDAPSR